MAELLVLVGTQKGVFVLRSVSGHGRFEVSGPYLEGEQAYSVAIDGRNHAARLLAGSTSDHWGTVVRSSDDVGATWTDPTVGNLKFPADTGAAVAHVWQLQPAGPAEPEVVHAGVEPAALFRSDDRGETFELVRGLWDHPHRPEWEPGGGGLCLHTIVTHPGDPGRILVGISAAGVYRTGDGGATWEACNRGIRAADQPDSFPEFGQCVHRAAPDANQPETVFLQSHGGLYRTDDFGGSWQDIAAGAPSDFGFPIVTHPRRSGVAYVIPLESDERRWTVGGTCRVFRTPDGGGSWEPLGDGLPQTGAYLTVLRDAFCADGLDPVGLYFGTRSGELYGSADEGESWDLLASHLPPRPVGASRRPRVAGRARDPGRPACPPGLLRRPESRRGGRPRGRARPTDGLLHAGRRRRALPRGARSDPRRAGNGAPSRERIRRRREHPLGRRPGHAGARRR